MNPSNNSPVAPFFAVQELVATRGELLSTLMLNEAHPNEDELEHNPEVVSIAPFGKSINSNVYL